MPSYIPHGTKMAEIDLINLFPPYDGMITQYYGRIGSGKTYAATADILDLLRRGQVVYANWKINYKGYDQRRSFVYLFVSIIFPWRKQLMFFPPDNLKYFEFSDKWAMTQGYPDFIEWLSSRTDCHIFGDEGHVMFDSYQGMRASIEKRASILHTRHFDRSIHIISQRPTAIHVSMRANVNIFYRCEKKLQLGSIIRFRRVEFQDMQNENVDEDEEKIISTKGYWGKQRIFEAYDTKYLRGEVKASQQVHVEGYEYGLFARFVLLWRTLRGGPIEEKGDIPDVFKPWNEQFIHSLSTPLLLLPRNPRRLDVVHLLADDTIRSCISFRQ